MIPYIIEYFANAVDAFMLIYFILGFTKKTLSEAPHGVAAAFLIFAVCCVGTNPRWSTAATLVSIGIAYLFSITVRGASLARRLTAPGLFHIILCAINIITINIHRTILGSEADLLVHGSPERFGIIISSKVLVIFAVFITLRLLKRDVAFTPGDLILYILFPTVSISIQICITHMSQRTGVSTMPLWLAFPMAGLVIINFVTIFVFERIGDQAREKAELQLLQSQTEFEKDKYSEMKALYDQVRSVRHDFSNHLTYLRGMLDMGECEKAKKYLDTLCEQAVGNSSPITTGHRTLDFILNSKIDANPGISFHVSGTVRSLPESSFDLVVLLGNVLDNAIECAGASREKYISIEFYVKNCYQNILCKNSCDSPVLENNPLLTTTKKDSALHGLGVKNIKRITEKYSGISQFYDEDGVFCVHIALPVKENEDD